MAAEFAPLEQQRAALWSGADARVFAVIDAGVLPGLLDRLNDAGAEVAGFDALRRGALTPGEAATAPWLVGLPARSSFTDWLLAEAGAGLDGWGLLVTAPVGLRPLRDHLRGLNEALTPAGRRVALRWWDARLLGELMPTLSAPQLAEVFGPVRDIVVPSRTGWTWWHASAGRPVGRDRPFAA